MDVALLTVPLVAFTVTVPVSDLLPPPPPLELPPPPQPSINIARAITVRTASHPRRLRESLPASKNIPANSARLPVVQPRCGSVFLRPANCEAAWIVRSAVAVGLTLTVAGTEQVVLPRPEETVQDKFRVPEKPFTLLKLSVSVAVVPWVIVRVLLCRAI